MERTITAEHATSHRRWRVAAAPIMALALLVLGLWNLAGPELWWDEGWTLSVARTWVERGHYGRLLEGQLATGGLQAAPAVTGAVALSFRLFGVGIWQGRLPGVMAMVAALALMYALAARLYNRRVALGTLFVMLFMSIHPQLHPLIMGRQVLGEMYMLCFLLAGYICLHLALNRSPWWIAPAAISWGLALNTKAQLLPFWAVSLAAPLMVALLRRRWREIMLLGAGLVGGYAVLGYGLPVIWAWILSAGREAKPISLGEVQGIYDVTAFVPNAFNRWFAVQIVLIAGLPTLGGLCHGLWRATRALRQPEPLAAEPAGDIVRLALLALAGSWVAWFLLLSVGVPRYLFPATFVGSIFVAAWLSDLTGGFDLAATLHRARRVFGKGPSRRQAGGALLAILLLAATLPITIQTLYREYILATDTSSQEVADFLNTQTPPGARIETYESELHFLLDRPYHYPPDQVHVELNRRGLLHQETEIQYDPLAADPDYLVVGRFARGNNLYMPVIESGTFELVRSYGRSPAYLVYKRIR